MIKVQINGKPVELELPTPLLAYLKQLGVNPRAVAVEHNGAIIERAGYEAITLGDGDTIEIVRMVGGGSSPGPPTKVSAPSGLPVAGAVLQHDDAEQDQKGWPQHVVLDPREQAEVS